MTRALIIGQNEQLAIDRLKTQAARNVIDATQAVKQDPEAVRRANDRQTIGLPRGFCVTYTVERQPTGLYHHLSISVDAKGQTPNPAAIDLITEMFGLESPRLHDAMLMTDLHDSSQMKHETAVWAEDLPGDRTAINILQSIEAKPCNS